MRVYVRLPHIEGKQNLYKEHTRETMFFNILCVMCVVCVLGGVLLACVCVTTTYRRKAKFIKEAHKGNNIFLFYITKKL